MIKNLEEQKAKTKAAINKNLDEYYEAFAKASNQEGFDINTIERLMLENQRKLKQTLQEAEGELASSVETTVKKKCPRCQALLERAKKGEKLRIKTMNGELEIARDCYYCRTCRYIETPLDVSLGLTGLPYKMTKELMLEVAYYGQNQSSFTDASDMLYRALHMEINKETVREVTEAIGRRVFEADSEKAEYLLNNMHTIEMKGDKEKTEGTLYLMADGAAVNTRVEDENGSTWRENKTAIAFTDKDLVKRKNEKNIIARKEYTAFIGDADTFRGYVLNIAVKAGYGKVKDVVLIGDGAAWIRNMGEDVFPDAVQILDLYHLKENVYSYAKYKYKQNEKEYVPWAEAFIEKVENGKAEEALRLLPKKEKLPTGVVNLRTYVKNNMDKIKYPEYKAKGYFVGSGAIESANKVILQRRLKQSGMRWGVPGAQAVLTLRAKVESRLWDSDVKALFVA